MFAGLTPIEASAGAAGCWVQGAPSQGSGCPGPVYVCDDAPIAVKPIRSVQSPLDHAPRRY